MKGKIFILFIIVGIPAMMWVAVSWLIMIALGALHSVCNAIPALSFWASLIVAMVFFTTIAFALISAAAEPAIPPAQRPLTLTPEETVRRQKS